MGQDNPIALIGVGSPVMDSLINVDDAFVAGIDGEKGGMVLVDDDQMIALMGSLPGPVSDVPGGSSGNTTFALARLGTKVAFLGKVGKDDTGTLYSESLVKLGGDAARIKLGDVATGRCLSLVTPDGERTMRTHLGAAMTLSPAEVEESDFRGCGHAHIEGYLLFNRELMDKVLKTAKATGCTISVDLASFEVVEATKDILEGLLRDYVDVVLCNEEEASQFFSEDMPYEKMAEKLGELCDVVCLKLGKKGAIIAQGGKLHTVEPLVVENCIDTTGAGDFWAAGFFYGWLQGKPLAECGRFGSILGAEVVQQLGADLPDERWEAVAKQLS